MPAFIYVLARTAVVVCLLASALSTLRVYPHQLAYFNELAGGPENGHRHMLGSSLDWGQDLLLLREWMRSHELAKEDVRIVRGGANHLAALFPETRWHAARWEALSTSRVFHRTSSYVERVENDPRLQRIGYTIWVFPLK